ncbi:MAG: hypothetical protein NT128_08220 [Proteobacteria bacterium]|nr:hypothetical protein [Pseudomonadota bacterium]
MKLFQWFTLAFLLSFNTLTNSIFAAEDNNAGGTSESEEGEEPEEAEEEEEESAE